MLEHAAKWRGTRAGARMRADGRLLVLRPDAGVPAPQDRKAHRLVVAWHTLPTPRTGSLVDRVSVDLPFLLHRRRDAQRSLKIRSTLWQRLYRRALVARYPTCHWPETPSPAVTGAPDVRVPRDDNCALHCSHLRDPLLAQPPDSPMLSVGQPLPLDRAAR